MRIEIALHGADERVAVTRDDGSTARFRVPRKGPVSHDIVHYCVESVLGIGHGFWGMVAAGAEPDEIQELAKAGGHASAKRAEVPDDALVEILQVERLVECFEAESWSAGEDDAGLMAMAEAGWASSHVPPLVLAPSQIAAIRSRLRDLGAKWQALPAGRALTLEWS